MWIFQSHWHQLTPLFPRDEWINGPFGTDLQDSMRSWLYSLHENVNQSREVVSGISLESLKDLYKGVNLREHANDLKSMYHRGLLIRSITAETWKVAWKHLDMLLRIIS